MWAARTAARRGARSGFAGQSGSGRDTRHGRTAATTQPTLTSASVYLRQQSLISLQQAPWCASTHTLRVYLAGSLQNSERPSIGTRQETITKVLLVVSKPAKT